MYEDDYRNAPARRVVSVAPPRPAGGSYAAPPYYPPQAQPAPSYYGPPMQMQPYGQPPMMAGCSPSPLINPMTGALRIGLIADAAAQAIAALQNLPAPPPVLANDSQNIGNLIEYQHSLANAAKADERLRTIGTLARLFFGS